MTLTHLNQKFLQSPPLPATPFGTALVKVIRERLLLPTPEPVNVSQSLFDWLLEMTESTPTATSFGTRFVRVMGNNENFIDVIELKATEPVMINQALNNEAPTKSK